MLNVVIFAPDRVSTFEFSCALEIFALDRSDLGVPWYRTIIAAERAGTVTSTAGLGIVVPNGLNALDAADTIVVPCWESDVQPSAAVIAAFTRAANRGARILSICSGAFLLGYCGLLAGRKATTHWQYAERFKGLFPTTELVADVLYVDEGAIITSAGSAAGLDMLLHVIRKDHGPRICNLVARRLVVQPHREGGQAQFVERPVAQIADSRLAKVIEWMRANARDDLRIKDLADRAAMSPRTFFRKFKSATGMAPHEWLIRERVAIARDLLEEFNLPIENVATEAGFGAVETLRYHFRRYVKTSPADYRRAYLSPENLLKTPARRDRAAEG